MGFYTVISTTKPQAQALFDKHMKPFFKNKSTWFGIIKPSTITIPKIINYSFSYDDEDSIGFVTLNTSTGKKISYQLRGNEPMFIEFTGFGDVRYDIAYPKELNEEMYNLLKEYGNKAKTNFWEGGEI